MPPGNDDPVCLRVMQRLDQHTVNDAEDSGVRPDADGNGDDRKQGNARRPCEAAPGKSQILDERQTNLPQRSSSNRVVAFALSRR